jgi:hypothetical protein
VLNAESTLKELSVELNTRPVNGQVAWGASALRLKGSDAALNVFQVTASDLGRSSFLSLHVPAGSISVINVQGTSVKTRLSDIKMDTATQQEVLWNFPSAVSLGIGGIGMRGSVLAPLADVKLIAGAIEGTLTAKSASGSGTFLHRPFIGSICAGESEGSQINAATLVKSKTDDQGITTAASQTTVNIVRYCGKSNGHMLRLRGPAGYSPTTPTTAQTKFVVYKNGTKVDLYVKGKKVDAVASSQCEKYDGSVFHCEDAVYDMPYAGDGTYVVEQTTTVADTTATYTSEPKALLRSDAGKCVRDPETGCNCVAAGGGGGKAGWAWITLAVAGGCMIALRRRTASARRATA